MNIRIEELTDDNVRYFVKNNLELFIEPIKKNQKQYLQYTSLLGNMNKKSLLVQKNLPNIVVKLYRRQDMYYTKAVENEANRFCELLLKLVSKTMDRDVSLEEFLEFSNEQIADMLIKFQDGAENVLEIDLLIMQMKLIGFSNVEERVKEIISLCGIEVEQKENIEDILVEEVKKSIEEKNTIVEKRVKPKKLTSEEKAAKNKAAIEAKEKAKELEIQLKEEKFTGEEKEVLEATKVTQKTNVIAEEKEMSRYIGVVNIKSNFYNFTPIGVYENGTYTAFSENDIDRLLVKSLKHNINFYYNYWDDIQTKFMKEKFIEGYPVLLNCDIEELDENKMPDGELNPTGYKIQAMEAWNRKKISSLSDAGLYVLLSKDELLDDDIISRRVIRIEKEGLVEGTQVLVNLGDGFYAGPFTVKYSSTSYAFHIVMQASEGKRFINGYNSSDCERVIVDMSEEVGNWVGHNSWCYYSIKNNATQIAKDYISDKELLETFKASIEKNKGLDYTNLDIDGIIEGIGESQIVGGSIIPDTIKEQRIARIREIMSSEEELKKIYAETAELICELLLKNKDSKQTEQLISEMISKKPELLETIPGVKAIQSKVESARAELEQLEVQKTEMEAHVKSIHESAEIPETNIADIEHTLSEEVLAKKAELTSLLEKIGVAETAIDLQNEIKRLKDEVTYYDSHKLHLVNDTNNLRAKFVEFVNGYSDKMAEITFDGFMSSKMLQAASDWETKMHNEELSSKVETLNNIISQEMNANDLVEYLVKLVQIARPGYSKNTIINIFICATQGFLTVFSGQPGCGKTSICNIVSKVLGLNSYEGVDENLKDSNRYISVSVERGWTSKRDFIGYYNPLTKAFEESNMKVFNGLKLLDMEKQKGYSKWPFIILLDEANLSPMEYYWADFMNVCDDFNDNSSINLGNDNVFKLPDTLHFLATINNDHTTEILSPRLIDRAWIVTLPKFSSLHFGGEISDEQVKNISWSELKNVFTISGYERKNFDRETQMIYDGLKEKLLKQDLYVSPRVDIAIQKYWVVASKLMEEDEFNNSSSLVALDYAIAQKILPKIIGSGEEYESWLNELYVYCDNKGLLHSAELIEDIISRGNRQMKYYQFFN